MSRHKLSYQDLMTTYAILGLNWDTWNVCYQRISQKIENNYELNDGCANN